MRSSLQQTPDTFPNSVTSLLKRPDLWQVILRAVLELALARYKLGRRNVRDVIGKTPARAHANTVSNLLADPLALRVAWAIPRVAARVPWRSDCLVQATAAQRWLASNHLDCELHIGVKKVPQTGFQAHAWLSHRALIVTGGDISGYVPVNANTKNQ